MDRIGDILWFMSGIVWGVVLCKLFPEYWIFIQLLIVAVSIGILICGLLGGSQNE